MYDPTGPGSPAWEASEALIEARIKKDRKAQHRARQRLTAHLAKHGQAYAPWKKYVREQVEEARAMNA